MVSSPSAGQSPEGHDRIRAVALEVKHDGRGSNHPGRSHPRGHEGSPRRQPGGIMQTTAAAAPRTKTIKEAAEATGRTQKSIRNRVDRGTLQSLLRGRVRHIPVTELIRVGLLDVNGEAPGEAASGVGNGSLPQRGGTPGVNVNDLIVRLEEQATELGRLRALQEAATTTSQQAEARADRLQEELLESRANLSGAEAKLSVLEQAERRPRRDPLLRRRWLRRR